MSIWKLSAWVLLERLIPQAAVHLPSIQREILCKTTAHSQQWPNESSWELPVCPDPVTLLWSSLHASAQMPLCIKLSWPHQLRLCLAFTAMSNTLAFRLNAHHLPALPLSPCLSWSPCFCLHYRFSLSLPVYWASPHIRHRGAADEMMELTGIWSTKKLKLKTPVESHHLGSELDPPENFAMTGISQPYCKPQRSRKWRSDCLSSNKENIC